MKITITTIVDIPDEALDTIVAKLKAPVQSEPIQDNKLLTTAEYGLLVGLSAQTIRNKFKAGELYGVKEGNLIWIYADQKRAEQEGKSKYSPLRKAS